MSASPLPRIGFELELLAPPGRSRETLALALAAEWNGSVRKTFYAGTEPSKVPGKPVFYNLTPGFEVRDSCGGLRCTLVDDVTIRADLNSRAVPGDGWYRIVSDDSRLLRLVSLHCDAAAPLSECLKPFADIFNGRVDVSDDGYVSVLDAAGASLAIGAPQGGERERPCEIVTALIAADHQLRLEEILGPARQLGFTVPREAAVHLHFDGPPLRNPHAMRNLVRYVYPRQALLRWLLGTNEECRGLGWMPPELAEAVESDGFVDAGWQSACAHLQQLRLSKYADLNLANLLHPTAGKDTIEWRMLPGAVNAEPVVAKARILAAVLRRALQADDVPRMSEALAPNEENARVMLGELGIGA